MTNNTKTIRQDTKGIPPFYIDCTHLSEDQVINIINKSVQAGAVLKETCDPDAKDTVYGWDCYEYNEWTIRN